MKEEQSEVKQIKSNANSALSKLGQLPKVGGALGGYDISLGFSHRYALEIAMDVISELKAKEKSQIFIGVSEVFKKWKDQHGVYSL